ncbi:MAG TPA: DUF6351 family protein [Solimonas sp.]|nr:DUF6351 family protein [Solimonas sp.]
MKHQAMWFVVISAVALLAGCHRSDPVSGEDAATGSGSAMIKVLSNRADLISGGDALVELLPPADAPDGAMRVSVGGRDVSAAFAKREDGRITGLVTGMALGRNVLTASFPGGARGSTVIVNHPNGGPVFSGPQLQPWTCQEAAVDAACNQPPEYSYLYKSINPLMPQLLPYDPENPPGDVASTTTDQGVTVPFVVRVEIGYQDRNQYRIATLFQPEQPWEPWAPQEQWNHKLLISHGGGCGTRFNTWNAPTTDYSGTFDFLPAGLGPLLGDSPTVALGLGFAVMSTALNDNGKNCNIVTQAESLMMAKERLVEAYGPLRYTIGTGCSGGSITQQQVANAYPGIYQGILPQCSFPDSWSSATQVLDYRLLRGYFESPAKWALGVIWTPLQWAAVEGNLLPVNAIVSDIGYFDAFLPHTPKTGLDPALQYHHETNPGGVRGGVPDAMINVLGPRQREVWTPNEQALGHGFAGVGLDNTGVQYGLETLRQALITPDMFLDLNAKIGGFDIDVNPVPQRMVADRPALTNIYRSGALNVGNNLSEVAIINLTGPDVGIAHDAYRAFAVRDRLTLAQGHHDNHVIWYGPVVILGDPGFTAQGLVAMDRWLAAVEADTRDLPLAQKIVSDRPADLKDRCVTSSLATPDGFTLPILSGLLDPILGPVLAPILDPLNAILYPVLAPAFGLVVDPVLETVCGPGLVGDLVTTRFSTARVVAGDALSTLTNKCQLKPLDRSDNYGALGFSDAQWARMQEIFPQGVCDFGLPPVDIQPTIPWQTYQDEQGRVIYGGRPLPPAPVGVANGWTGAAFRSGP